MQPAAIAPLLIVLVGAVVALVVGIFLPRRMQTWNALLAAAVLLTAMCVASIQLGAPPGPVFQRSFIVDGPALSTMLTLMATVLLCIGLAVPAFRHDQREAEFYALLLFSLLGAMVLAGAGDVMEILLGVLLTSVGSYALVAWRRADRQAVEAVLKYYLFGALTNVGLIYGLVLLYGLSGSTLLGDIGAAVDPANRLALALAAVLVLLGLGFKAGWVPAHFWIPDVYQGTTVPVAAFLSVVPKIAALLALARVSAALEPAIDLAPLVALLAAVTMTWGNLAAFVQHDLRRLLGYSTISQTGYLLMAVVALRGSAMALPGLLYYFAAYAAANVGAFAVIAATGRCRLDEQRGLVRAHPWLAVAMLVSLMSLLGLPPLAGFVGKFVLFSAAWDAGYGWLTALALVNSALSLYYYLRVLAPMFLGAADGQATIARLPSGVALASAAASIGIGLAAFLLLDRGQLALLH